MTTMSNAERGQQTGTFNIGSGQVSSNSPPPRIMPNRRQIDNRFPVLGFTVYTGSLPYFEVLLSTDRSLFDPTNVGRRNAGNFYASRQDSGLIHITGASGIYLVPPAVLRSFAQAQPQPSAIFYTLIAYQAPDGTGPVFAHPPEKLPTEAPSVSISSGFSGHTLSSVLGIPMEKLQRVTDRPTASTALGNILLPMSEAQSTTGIDAGTDRAEGEDGYGRGDEGMVSEYSYGESRVSASSDRSSQEPGTSQNGTRHHRRPSQSELPPVRASSTVSSWSSIKPANDHNGYLHTDMDIAYDDGYGNMSDYDVDHSPTHKASSSFAVDDEHAYQAGQTMPAPLENYEDRFDTYDDDEIPYRARSQPGNVVAHGSSYPVDTPMSIPTGLEEDQGYEEEDERASDDEEYYDNEDYHGERWKYEPEQGHRVRTAHYGDEAEEFDGAALGLDYTSLDAPPSSDAGAPPQQAHQLTIDDKRRIIERTGRFESGDASYAAINADEEFKGTFKNHPAHKRYHIGLSFGIIQFTQDSGMLGRLLTMMKQRDATTFSQIFGEHADELIRTTTSVGPPSRDVAGGRSVRVQPVDGKDLWEEPWVSRFLQAGQHRPFQAAQNQLASEGYLDTMLLFARWLGLDTDRALTMVVDRAVQMGVNGARKWIIDAVGPVQTPAQRRLALTALNYVDLLSFQKATNGLDKDGQWGHMTHAAMVAALRNLGSASPIQLLTREQMMEAMVRRAAGNSWAKRVEQVHNGSAFAGPRFVDLRYYDIPYQL